jgi:hypothetical protein
MRASFGVGGRIGPFSARVGTGGSKRSRSSGGGYVESIYDPEKSDIAFEINRLEPRVREQFTKKEWKKLHNGKVPKSWDFINMPIDDLVTYRDSLIAFLSEKERKESIVEAKICSQEEKFEFFQLLHEGMSIVSQEDEEGRFVVSIPGTSSKWDGGIAFESFFDFVGQMQQSVDKQL